MKQLRAASAAEGAQTYVVLDVNKKIKKLGTPDIKLEQRMTYKK